MHTKHYIGLAMGCFAMAMANPVTVSVGDAAKYSGSAGTTPTVSGSVVEFTAAAKADGSVEAYLSPDLQKAVKAAMDDNCKTLNDGCFQSVRSVLVNPNTELVPRQIGIAVAATVAMIAYLFPILYKDEKLVPVPIVLNPSDLSVASAAATATEVVVVPTSGAAITITPKPNAPIAATGTAIPAITAFPTGGNGHDKGDVVLTLPGDLANRLSDYMAMVPDSCPSAQTFNGKKLRKRQDNYGAVICRAEALVGNAGAAGPFQGLQLVHPPALPWTAADVTRAMAAVVAFARDLAPVLELTLEAAGDLGTVAFIIAWETYNNQQKLSNSNTIPGKSLQGTTSMPTTTTPHSSSTTTGCPTPSCDAGCTKIGAIALCSTTCKTPSGTCSATTSATSMEITTTATQGWVVSTGFLEFASMAPSPVSSALAEATQSCHPKNTTAPVGAIDGPTQSNFARTFCTKFDQTFNSTSPAVLWNALSASYKDQLSPYHYTVRWIPGCTTSVAEQSMNQPLGASNAGVNCVSLLTENFSRCTSNNGAGGTRDVGCLRYNFAQTLDKNQLS